MSSLASQLVCRWGLLLILISLNGCQLLPLQPSVLASSTLATTHFQVEEKSPVIGHITRLRLKPGDTLSDVARHFDIGLQAIQDANPGIDPWLPPPGRPLILPLAFLLPEGMREGIVINLPAMRLYYFPPDHTGLVQSYPVGIGREGWGTPLGQTRVVQKTVHPRWVVPSSIRREHALKGDPLPKIVPPGPDNPLGSHALRLGFSGYLIHGTNKPYGVGLRVSHGCIRLYPDNITALFPQVKIGTPVTIVDQPYLIGWRGDRLYVQIHPPLQQRPSFLNKLRQTLDKRLHQAEAISGQAIDWSRVDQAIAETRGIPIPVLKSSPSLQHLMAKAPEIDHPPRWRGQYQPPPLTAGWYVNVDTFLTPQDNRKLVAMLRHQAPPFPAHYLDNRILIGPFVDRPSATGIKKRLGRDMQLDSRLLPPDQSRPILEATAAES